MGGVHFVALRATIAGAVAFVLAFPSAGLAQNSPLVGTWKLVPERSTFEPGPVPYSTMTLNFSATERGLTNRVKGVDTEGRPIDATYFIVTDGRSHPVIGEDRFDSSSYVRVNDATTVYMRRKHGTTVIAGSRMLGRDGKTLYFREKRVDDEGRERGRALLVFEKEQGQAAASK